MKLICNTLSGEMDQSEVSIQVTWSFSTNQRPVFITHCLVKWSTFCPTALENHSNNNIHSGHIYNWTQSGYFSSQWTLYGFLFPEMEREKEGWLLECFLKILPDIIHHNIIPYQRHKNNYTLKQQDTNIAGVWSFIDGGIIALTLIGPPL